MVGLEAGAVGGWEVARPRMHSENRAILIADGLGRGKEAEGKKRGRVPPEFLDSPMALETYQFPGKADFPGAEQGPQ